jgi:hypothetical protein
LVEATATLTDEILDLQDRVFGSFFTKAKNKQQTTFAAASRAMNEKLRLYAKVGSALIDAKEKGCDAFRRLKLLSHGKSLRRAYEKPSNSLARKTLIPSV